MKLSFETNSNSLMCDMAKWCAEAIYHAGVRQNLQALRKAGLAEDHPAYTQPVIDASFRDAQSIIRSISDHYDRMSFVALVKLCFRDRRGNEHARTRDYVNSVRRYQQLKAA